jgi:flagella basal body P-ring formation protein FlgA
MPIQNINKSTIQTKHRLKDGTVLTKRDVIGLFLVKRGSNVNVILNNLNISISFSAKAVQNGRYGDTVSVIRHDGKKLKAVVTGKNTVEIK